MLEKVVIMGAALPDAEGSKCKVFFLPTLAVFFFSTYTCYDCRSGGGDTALDKEQTHAGQQSVSTAR